MNNEIPEKRRAASIGTFDGVHRGHHIVLDTVVNVARDKDMQPVALTFDRHPLQLIAPKRAPGMITTMRRKNYLIEKRGVWPITVAFDDTTRKMTAKEWMMHLRDYYNIDVLVVGYDNTFGCDGVNMSVADYRDIGTELGIEIIEAPIVEGVSSSAIRKAIARGDIEGAALMLGRPYHLPGTVTHGNKLGHTIGYPTANLQPMPGLLIPASGVYAAEAVLPDGNIKKAMVNIGTRPTIKRGNELTIEAHIINWDGDLYGKPLRLYFHKRLRDERQFKSIDELREQLAKDKTATLSAF